MITGHVSRSPRVLHFILLLYVLLLYYYITTITTFLALFCLFCNFLSTALIKYSSLVAGRHACCSASKLLLLLWEKSAPWLSCSLISWTKSSYDSTY
jgi:hypothetical protein